MAETVLYGRGPDIDSLRTLLDGAARGRAHIGLLEGEAGIGKTRLLTEVLREAEDRGFRRFVGRAEEFERTRPFAALAAAFGCTRDSPDPRRAAIGRLVAPDPVDVHAPMSVTSDPGLEFRAVEAFVELAETTAIEGPMALALEDLQWADPSTLLGVRSLIRRLTDVPFSVLATYRPSPRVPELERFVEGVRDEGALHLVLGPLDDDAVVALAAEAIGAEPGPGLLAGLAGAAGNPLFVKELLRALEQEGVIEVTAGRAEAARMEVPPSLRLTILRRIGFLPARTLEALRIASVLGSTFSLASLGLLLDRRAALLATDLGEALRAGVLEEQGRVLRFRHDLIREAVYEDIPASVRAGLHRDAGRRMREAGAPVLDVAEHVALGAEPGDREAVVWLQEAARQAAPRAPDIAVNLLQRALPLVEAGGPLRDGLRADMAVSLMWSGRVAEAEATCREILGRSPDPSVEGAVRVCLGHALLAEGRAREALEELDIAISAPPLSQRERTQARAWGSHARMLLGDLEGAVEMAGPAAAAAEELEEPLIQSVALGCVAMTAEFRGDFGTAVDLIENAVRLADQSPDHVGHRFQLNVFRGLFLLHVDRFDAAEQALQQGWRISEELGSRWTLPLYEIALILRRFLSGEWDDAMAECDAALRLTEEIGTRHGLVSNYSVRSLIALHRNDLGMAEDSVAAAEREFAESGPQYRSSWMMWARALLLEASGAIRDAFEVLSNAWDLCEGMQLAMEFPYLAPDVVRVALEVGDRRRAESAVTAVEGVAAKNPEVATLQGAALRCRGLLDGDPGTLLASVEAYRRGPRPLQRALVSEEAAAALAEAGKAKEARALLEEALEVYDGLEASRDAARGEATLRGMGFRRGARGRRKRPAVGWESLTETELRVVRLVAEGLSNRRVAERLFISPRTVQTHVAHAFAKLGVSSRVELAAQAGRRGGP